MHLKKLAKRERKYESLRYNIRSCLVTMEIAVSSSTHRRRRTTRNSGLLTINVGSAIMHKANSYILCKTTNMGISKRFRAITRYNSDSLSLIDQVSEVHNYRTEPICILNLGDFPSKLPVPRTWTITNLPDSVDKLYVDHRNNTTISRKRTETSGLFTPKWPF